MPQIALIIDADRNPDITTGIIRGHMVDVETGEQIDVRDWVLVAAVVEAR